MSTPRTDPVADLRSLLLASQRFRQAMADQLHVNISELVVLGHLADASGELTPGELSERMLLGSGTLTAVLDRLARAGLAQRKPNPADRRSSLLALTPAGRRIVRQLNGRLERALGAARPADDTGVDRGAADLARLAGALNREADLARAAGAKRPQRPG